MMLFHRRGEKIAPPMAKRSSRKKRSNREGKGRGATPIAKADHAALPGASPAPLPLKGGAWMLVQTFLILGAILWIFGPALRGEWLWDDALYFQANQLMDDPDRIWKAWFAPGSFVEYYPLQETLQWLQWRAWGNEMLGYHLTNVVLHGISSLLVWRLLNKLGIRLAWLGGLLFAIHPVQVESVALIAELKNALSLPPFLLAMCAWIDFEAHRRNRDYWLAFAFFLVAMLCKISMSPFPVVILIYAWWKRDRIGWGDVKTAAPFFLVSLILGSMTIFTGFWHAQYTGPGDLSIGGPLSRVALVGLSLSFYLAQCFFPVDMMPIYPQWTIDPPSPGQFLPWPILAGMSYWFWTKRRTWGRHALLALGFFIVMLLPFIGVIAASYMTFTWVMDHFLYIPIIALIALATAGLGQIQDRVPKTVSAGGMAVVALLLVFLAVESRSYARMFTNPETFWSYALQRNPEAWPAHNNLGNGLLANGRNAEAIEQYELSLRVKPGYYDAHYNLGNAFYQTGRTEEAIEQLQTAIRIDPHFAEAHFNLGNALLRQRRVAEAADQFRQAAQISPRAAAVYLNWGVALRQLGRLPEAIEQFQKAVQINPAYAEAHYNLGNALQKAGRIPEAIDQFEKTVDLQPKYADAHHNLGVAFNQMGRTTEAIQQFEIALEIDPHFAEAHYNLGVAFSETGRKPEAIEQFQKALQIKPTFTEAQKKLASLQSPQQAPKR
jgi:tetratricopeptide (TPR) repeat protein